MLVAGVGVKLQLILVCGILSHSRFRQNLLHAVLCRVLFALPANSVMKTHTCIYFSNKQGSI